MHYQTMSLQLVVLETSFVEAALWDSVAHTIHIKSAFRKLKAENMHLFDKKSVMSLTLEFGNQVEF